jgi:hypothetical protein
VVSANPWPLYPPGKRLGTHCIEGWVGSRAGMDGCGKSRPPPLPEFEPRTVQPVASRYIGCAIPAPGQHTTAIVSIGVLFQPPSERGPNVSALRHPVSHSVACYTQACDCQRTALPCCSVRNKSLYSRKLGRSMGQTRTKTRCKLRRTNNNFRSVVTHSVPSHVSTDHYPGCAESTKNCKNPLCSITVIQSTGYVSPDTRTLHSLNQPCIVIQNT